MKLKKSVNDKNSCSRFKKRKRESFKSCLLKRDELWKKRKLRRKEKWSKNVKRGWLIKSQLRMTSSFVLRLVVVRHLDAMRIAILEAKANPPLVVDVDGVPALPISAQGMKPVAGGDPEIIEPCREVNILQSLHRSPDDIWWQPARLACEEQVAGVLVSKRLDHEKCTASRDTCQLERVWQRRTRHESDVGQRRPQLRVAGWRGEAALGCVGAWRGAEGRLGLGRWRLVRCVEELGDELPYSLGFVFL